MFDLVVLDEYNDVFLVVGVIVVLGGIVDELVFFEIVFVYDGILFLVLIVS